MGLIGNAGLANNATANTCLHVAQTVKSMGIWAYTGWFNSLWKPAAGTTIPQAFAAIGTAYSALAADMAALGLLLAAEGYTLPTTPAGWTVTQNADGSATPSQAS
jgi:hypothetical protein